MGEMIGDQTGMADDPVADEVLGRLCVQSTVHTVL